MRSQYLFLILIVLGIAYAVMKMKQPELLQPKQKVTVTQEKDDPQKKKRDQLRLDLLEKVVAEQIYPRINWLFECYHIEGKSFEQLYQETEVKKQEAKK